MMKQKLISGTIGAIAFMAVFYLGRQSGGEGEESQGSTAESGTQPMASEGFERKVASEQEAALAAATKSDNEAEEAEEARNSRRARGEAQRQRFADAISKRNEEKVARLVARLVEQLGLDESQKAELEAYFAEQLASTEGLMAGETNDPMAAIKALQTLEGRNLSEALEGILTPEQQEEWTALETARTERSADSSALKNLASLNGVISLREEQRDAIYDHFYQKKLEEETSTEASAGMGALVSSFGREMGIEIDGSLLQGAMPDLSQASNGQERMAAMAAHREQQIDQQVEDLAPILDEQQQGEYREHLQSRGSLFESLFNRQN